MDQLKWTAQWIMDERFYGLIPKNVYKKQLQTTKDYEHFEHLNNQHMLVRKSFHLSKVQNVKLRITADDCYRLYINGEFVGLGPAQSNYFHYFYNSYDITKFLNLGENVIAVHVYYHGKICRSYNSGDYRQGLIAEIFADGDYLFGTDCTWKYTSAKEYVGGETIGYSTQYLENIDSRLQEKGWREPNFDDSEWSNAWCNISDDHNLIPQPTPPLEVYEIRPQAVHLLEKGHYLVDFGKDITGHFRMTAQGKNGGIVEIRCGDELLDNGRVRYELRSNLIYRESWILSGELDELQFFDWKGFRYVEVIADSDTEIKSESFAAEVRHYPFEKEACQFTTSDALLNSIWSICRNGVKCGSQDTYVEKREKGGYLGDNTIVGHAHVYLSGDLRLFKKAIHEIAILSSRVCPGLVAVAPGHFMQEIADYSFQWPLQLLEYYRQSGDLDFLAQMYPIADRLLRYFDKYRRPDGLLEQVTDKWNLVDWPKAFRDNYDFDLTQPIGPGCHNVINAFYFGAQLAVNEIRDILGLPEREDVNGFRKAFQNSFYNKETRLFVDAEGSEHSALHSNALPLLFDLVPDEAKSSVVNLIREKRLACGVYMSYFVLKALASAGEYKLVYDLITSNDLHSWATMVNEGATSCYEAWSKDLKWNTSLCHPWSASPIPILIEEIIGLKPNKPGWEEVRFQPHIPENLEFLKLKIRVAAGEIQVEHRNGKTSLILPEGVELAKTRIMNDECLLEYRSS